MTTLDIHTIAFPTAALRDAVQAEVPADDRAGLDLIVWSPEGRCGPGNETGGGTSGGESVGGGESAGGSAPDPDDIDAVVMPYMGAGEAVSALEGLAHLKLIQMQSTGYDPVADFEGRIRIATGAGAHAAATAELAVGLALARLRGIDVAARNMPSGTWAHERRWSLVDRTALIVGVGGIGEEIRARLEPFGVTVLRAGSRERDDEHGHVYASDDLGEVLPRAELVFLITPLTDATHHLVDADFLARLPDGAMIVNVSRGAVVDTDALLAELESGRLQAALDVVDPEPLPSDHPLWRAPNTLITPHEGGDTSAFEPRIIAILAQQVRRIAAGEDLLNAVGS